MCILYAYIHRFPSGNRLLTSLCVSRGLRNSLPRCSSMIRKSRQKTSWSSQSARGKSPAWTQNIQHHPTSKIAPLLGMSWWGAIMQCQIPRTPSPSHAAKLSQTSPLLRFPATETAHEVSSSPSLPA